MPQPRERPEPPQPSPKEPPGSDEPPQRDPAKPETVPVEEPPAPQRGVAIQSGSLACCLSSTVGRVPLR
jgi:hypothetical protein